ncbi:hypothetical protein GA0070616_4578 [Micromonospora nigra]|uniref:Uncharacterized protein n=1 Tax=Micromonospora nigra TaxID=145857 RepID=A0A1C6STT6_9ACTN|nr:hypothetical protein [Micromonospora nigra]SCL32878.1 hypothetical protein GA0070616_4578 [Micromonospora nigra]
MSTIAQLWTGTPKPIRDAAEEAAAIRDAQAGDNAATLRLFSAYQPALRAAVRAVTSIPADDARQAATVGFLLAVRAWQPDADGGGRLAGIMRQHIADALAEATGAANGGFSVPDRTLKRYFGILRRAGGCAVAAAELAPSFEMASDTFWAVWAAVKANGSLEEALAHEQETYVSPIGDLPAPRGVADAEDRVLCEAAFRAVTDVERDVCRLAYGFADFDPQPDAEIGARLGGMPRLKVQRTRTRALAKMADALGA